jgi:hypothetical protein
MEINFDDFRDSDIYEKMQDVNVSARFDGIHSEIVLKGEKTLVKILVASLIRKMADVDGVDTEEIIEELRDNIQHIVLNKVENMGEEK